MPKDYTSMDISAWTTGAGIAIGTNIDVGGLLMGAAATTVTLKVGTASVMSISSDNVIFDCPVAIEGALTGTSSGGSFAVIYRNRG